MLDRKCSGRQVRPTSGMIDSQTVKAPSAPGGGGYYGSFSIEIMRKLSDPQGFQRLSVT